MKVHFIAIGGSAMHNLAIALHQKGYQVTGSDDEVLEPSRSRLEKVGLLPEKNGWEPQKISSDLDAVILGMHALPDNPELVRAQELGLKVYSYPEYLYEQTKHKKRVVIAGSHGKTTVTSMVLHVLKCMNKKFDYMVGAQITGFDTMVGLSNDSEVAVFEGDEYLSSPIDRRPKFLWYKPDVALITGIAWDHINVFPTQEIYNKQFELFIETISKEGVLIFYKDDKTLSGLVERMPSGLRQIPYAALDSINQGKTSIVQSETGAFEMQIFGAHNMQNLSGALQVCLELGISKADFLQAMTTFQGAARRLQLLGASDTSAVFYDFAHAPSKVKATVSAVKEQFPGRKLIACVELHTFSSLNRAFLPHYRHALQEADEAYVFYNPEVVAHKKLPLFPPEEVQEAFDHPCLTVITNQVTLSKTLYDLKINEGTLLLMSSGNLAGLDLKKLSQTLLER
jgi:UDP-N-acetylmuramate: L-alanyl-gamma-D-glutamyl-meso-diaminopimelate ligase